MMRVNERCERLANFLFFSEYNRAILNYLFYESILKAKRFHFGSISFESSMSVSLYSTKSVIKIEGLEGKIEEKKRKKERTRSESEMSHKHKNPRSFFFGMD